MPDKVNLEIYQGDSFAAIVTVYNIDGSVADITGYTAQSQIRSDVADEDPTVEVEITALVSSPTVTLNIPKTATVDLAGCYVWDLQLTSDTGEITTILYGNVKVTQEVTRE